MKRILAFFTCVMTVIMLPACKEASPILKVIIRAEGADAADYEYLVVYDNGTSTETDAFVPDDASFYTAESGAFVSSVVNNKIINTLKTNANADETMTAIMQTAADSINHAIIQFTIITDGDIYLAFAKLNVNWQSPCILYEYDMATDSLTEIYRWDGVDLIGVSIE